MKKLWLRYRIWVIRGRMAQNDMDYYIGVLDYSVWKTEYEQFKKELETLNKKLTNLQNQ